MSKVRTSPAEDPVRSEHFYVALPLSHILGKGEAGNFGESGFVDLDLPFHFRVAHRHRSTNGLSETDMLRDFKSTASTTTRATRLITAGG